MNEVIDVEATEVVEKVVYVNVHMPQRLEGETFETYVSRRKESHVLSKAMIAGTPFWDSKTQKTYRKTMVK